MKDLLQLRFRLRAEELRALAGEMSVKENRDALLRTAEDYERMAQSAGLLELSRARLASLNARSAGADFTAAGAETTVETASIDDQIQIYRDMAADAIALAEQADQKSQQGWLSLARIWTELAERLQRSEP